MADSALVLGMMRVMAESVRDELSRLLYGTACLICVW